MERLIDTEDFRKVKENKLYKLASLLWTDEQKSCIIEDTFIFGFGLISKVKYLRNEILNGDYLHIIRVDDYYFLMLLEKETQKLMMSGQGDHIVVSKKVSFFQPWEEREFPTNIIEMIQKSKNIKEAEMALRKAMKMKAFW